MTKISIKFGFTLSEVLITLGIIGVVATLTTVALMNNTNQTEYKTAYKKMVSDIVQASKLSVIDNGGDLKDPTCGANRSRVSDLLAAHMSYSKKILPYSSDTDNCIRTTTKTLNGIVNAVASNQPGLVLNNGGCFAIMDYANHIARCPEIACPGSNYCTNVYMDVNGPNKGPNVIGKDIFWGSISYDGDYKPATYHGGLPGFEGSPANYVTSCATGTGVGCSTKYLLE